MTAANAHEAVELAARTAYGRLVAWLVSRSRDVAAAEDALADALHAALRTWPERGVPDRPEAWLLTAARRRLGETARHGRVVEAARATLELLADSPAQDEDAVPDKRLELMLACAHPGIDPAARAPLMLQVVLGLDAQRIASAFLTAPAAMSQRLVRAKARIRDAGIPFEQPGREVLPERLEAVLDALYAAYGAGWDDLAGADPRRRGFASEALWLARVVADLAPEEPEAQALLALMLHCEARRPARRDAAGGFIRLSDQDTALWLAPLIEEAEARLLLAARARRIGRYQLEAAIQSAHASRLWTGRTPWEGVAHLYEGLVRIAPSAGALLGRAAAVCEARGPAEALALLDALDANTLREHQPYWVLRAHLMTALGRDAEAASARTRAVGLTEDPVVRAHLLVQRG